MRLPYYKQAQTSHESKPPGENKDHIKRILESLQCPLTPPDYKYKDIWSQNNSQALPKYS
jgi:hypothetical protein